MRRAATDPAHSDGGNDDEHLPRFKAAALARAEEFAVGNIVPLYEQCYERAGQLAQPEDLIDIAEVVTAYFTRIPDDSPKENVNDSKSPTCPDCRTSTGAAIVASRDIGRAVNLAGTAGSHSR